MSLSHINIIMDRISQALPESQLVVFKSGTANQLDAMFVSTIYSQKEMAKNPDKIVGLFDCSMNKKEVRKMLIGAVR